MCVANYKVKGKPTKGTLNKEKYVYVYLLYKGSRGNFIGLLVERSSQGAIIDQESRLMHFLSSNVLIDSLIVPKYDVLVSDIAISTYNF